MEVRVQRTALNAFEAERTSSSPRLFVCIAPGTGSDRFLPDLAPQYTPRPALALDRPFPVQPPSEEKQGGDGLLASRSAGAQQQEGEQKCLVLSKDVPV